MMTIGGNANVVKKAVAPAIRNGSFVFISLNERPSNLRKIKNLLAAGFFTLEDIQYSVVCFLNLVFTDQMPVLLLRA